MLDKDAVRRILPLLVVLLSLTAFPAVARASAPSETQAVVLLVSAAPDAPTHDYVVQPGDTLWDIARANGMTLDELLQANDLDPSATLHVGQVLQVTGAPSPGSTQTEQPLQVYAVERGDTPWDIAIAHGMTVAELLQANNLSPSAKLHVGQELKVKSVPQPAEPPAAPPAPVEATASPAEPTTPEQSVVAPPAAAAEAPAPEQPAEVPPVPAIPDAAAIVFSLVNTHRAEAGLPALAWSPLLFQAAQAHADDCAGRNRGSHTGSDGSRLRVRLERAGYAPGNATENWANARSPEHAVAMWWNEPANGPHRRAILGRSYSEVGIGVARGGWGYYYIMDFASP
jgi:uncharacterized protein YkwD